MTTSTEELSIEELLTSLKKEMKIIKSEEYKLKKQIILLNEQFGNLVMQASQRYPEILNEDFAKRSARYTRESKPAQAFHPSQVLKFNPDSEQSVQSSEKIKRSTSLPVVGRVSDKAKLLMRQHSADTPTDKHLTARNTNEQSKRNGVCRSPAFRFSQNRDRRSAVDQLISTENGKGSFDTTSSQFDKNGESVDNERKQPEMSKLEHSGSTTESSDGSTVSTASKNSYSSDNMDTERKRKLKRRLIESKKNQDVVNLGVF